MFKAFMTLHFFLKRYNVPLLMNFYRKILHKTLYLSDYNFKGGAPFPGLNEKAVKAT